MRAKTGKAAVSAFPPFRDFAGDNLAFKVAAAAGNVCQERYNT
jgi:hypothetical protein